MGQRVAPAWLHHLWKSFRGRTRLLNRGIRFQYGDYMAGYGRSRLLGELRCTTPMCRSQLCAGRRLDVFRLGAARPLANRFSTHSFGTGGRVLVAASLRWIGIEVVGARPLEAPVTRISSPFRGSDELVTLVQTLKLCKVPPGLGALLGRAPTHS
jgi:hypothetical protein